MAIGKSAQRIATALAEIVPLALFLSLAFMELRRGDSSDWRNSELQFFEQSAWQEMEALARNLVAVGKPDAETLFWGLFGSTQLHHAADANRFANLLAQQRVLNWRIETEAAKLCRPTGRLNRLLAYRSRIVFVILLLIIAVQATSLLTWRNHLLLISILSALGCLFLLV